MDIFGITRNALVLGFRTGGMGDTGTGGGAGGGGGGSRTDCITGCTTGACCACEATCVTGRTNAAGGPLCRAGAGIGCGGAGGTSTSKVDSVTQYTTIHNWDWAHNWDILWVIVCYIENPGKAKGVRMKAGVTMKVDFKCVWWTFCCVVTVPLLFCMFFPKQCGHTEGVLTVSVKARCSIKVVSVASGIFPVNYRTERLLWHVHVHFDCAGLQKNDVPGGVPSRSSCNFPYKMALVQCPSAFRLCRLAQNGPFLL